MTTPTPTLDNITNANTSKKEKKTHAHTNYISASLYLDVFMHHWGFLHVEKS
jgi:hypothetical protein